jgi:release factor glutamine methyltransferase
VTHTPLALARLAAEHMRERGLENARLESELLLAAVLGVSRLDLYLQYERPLSGAEVARFRELVRRRLRREPLQYILGEAHFRELVLRVDPRVLIPRPETEVLVGEVLAWAVRRVAAGAAEGEGLSAVDIGTGSGAIALSLAREGPFRHVVATDLSAAALEVAAENAARSGLAERVEFREGALWEALGADERFDVVVSNPPYIAESEREELQPEVREWEPGNALFAADSGLEVLFALVAGAPSYLRPGGLLALEIGAEQGAAVVGRIEGTGAYLSARIVPDLAGRERVVLAESAGA